MDEKLKRSLASVLEETLQVAGWIEDPKATRLMVASLVLNHGSDGACSALVEFEDAIKFVNETLNEGHDDDLMKYLKNEVD